MGQKFMFTELYTFLTIIQFHLLTATFVYFMHKLTLHYVFLCFCTPFTYIICIMYIMYKFIYLVCVLSCNLFREFPLGPSSLPTKLN